MLRILRKNLVLNAWIVGLVAIPLRAFIRRDAFGNIPAVYRCDFVAQHGKVYFLRAEYSFVCRIFLQCGKSRTTEKNLSAGFLVRYGCRACVRLKCKLCRSILQCNPDKANHKTKL